MSLHQRALQAGGYGAGAPDSKNVGPMVYARLCARQLMAHKIVAAASASTAGTALEDKAAADRLFSAIHTPESLGSAIPPTFVNTFLPRLTEIEWDNATLKLQAFSYSEAFAPLSQQQFDRINFDAGVKLSTPKLVQRTAGFISGSKRRLPFRNVVRKAA